MIYGSICSGIEAATVAWHPLGWKPAFFAEIDKFPSAVLANHYPQVPNLGDFTKITPDQHEPIDLLVGGTPCQSFSISGLRGGMADARGNLALEFLRLAQRTRARWLVWENVPGVLSSNGGRDFGAILGGMVELGYGIAYRVLDAQYVRVDGFGRAVPQRRRRVFVVGYLGDWRRAAAVLFERASLLGDSAPRRETGERVAPTISARTSGGGGLGSDFDFDFDGGLVANSLRAQAQASHRADSDNYIPWPAEVGSTLNAHYGDKQGLEDQHALGGARSLSPEIAMGRQDAETETLIPTIGGGFDVAHALKADGFDASEDGTGFFSPIISVCMGSDPIFGMDVAMPQTTRNGDPGVIAFSSKDHGADAGEVSPTLRSMNFDKSHANSGGQVAIAIQERAVSDNLENGPQGSGIRDDGASFTLEARHHVQAVATSWAVRRLTPKECERLQGFPDGYTDVPWRGKNWTPDGPRYKALGNSMAVNVMRWIGRRIELVENV